MPPQPLETTLTPILGEGEDATAVPLLLRCVPFFDADNEHAGWMVALVDITRMRRAQSQRDEALRFISHDIREPSAAILTIIELARTHPEALPPSSRSPASSAMRTPGWRWPTASSTWRGPRRSPFAPKYSTWSAWLSRPWTTAWAAAKARQRAPAQPARAGRSAVHRRPQPDRAGAGQYPQQRHQVFAAGGRGALQHRGARRPLGLTVRDRGPGIAVELQSQLFQPFHRLHRDSHPERMAWAWACCWCAPWRSAMAARSNPERGRRRLRGDLDLAPADRGGARRR